MSGQIDNGLSADDWMLLADVEAPFTDHILSALAEKGIAAYAEPFTSPESSYLGTPRASGPSDYPSFVPSLQPLSALVMSNRGTPSFLA